MYDYDVIVVGAGPTGLATANLLGCYGVRTLIVERNAATVHEPRAVSIDDESLRTMQAIGAVDTVLERVVAGYGSRYLTPGGHPFLLVEPTGIPYGYPRRNAFRQPVLEAQLRHHLDGWPDVETLFGWTATAVVQEGDHVVLSLESTEGETRSVSCQYVVAADGASSPLRSMLGLSLDGETFAEKWLIVDLENSPAPSRETLVFCDVRRPCIALPGPDLTRRFEFKLIPTDDPATMTQDAVVGELLSTHGAAPDSRISRKTIYTFHARLAQTWSLGRVFLAGDACHLTPPFAGQGMNSGIRDAHNIAWKIAGVVQLGFDPKILESYEQERRGHVREMITLARRMGRIMGPRNWLTGFLTQTGFRLLGFWPSVRDYFGQMKYKPKPRFSQGLLIPDGRPARRTSVGRLLPQPDVRTTAVACKLDYVLGEGFGLLGFTDTRETFMRATSNPLFGLIEARRVHVTREAGREGRGDCVQVVDHTGALHAGLDRPDGRIFVIRPDRYVLGSFHPEEADAFAATLCALLGDPVHSPDPAATKPATAHVPAHPVGGEPKL